MSDQSRALPDRPSLRFLKLEAKRRLAAGEFGTLHEAQLAVAREHGRSSWAALKAAVVGERSPVADQVRWVASRFGDPDPAWVAPGEAELRDHFDDDYLAVVPPDTLAGVLRPVAASLREELVVTEVSGQTMRGRIGDLRVDALAEPDPPHRLTVLRLNPVDEPATDHRTAAPATRTSGDVPARAVGVADESFAGLGVAGLVLAGSVDGGAPWALARGWADLERRDVLLPDHRFPAYGITKVVTSTAVLRLVGQGRLDIDRPVNEQLTRPRLADDQVTVRDLLTHTGGVTSPAEQFADQVPADPYGPTVPCDGRRGTFVASNGGYAVLGMLIADVTGVPYPDAVASLVFAPLRMAASWFPVRWPEADAVTGYHVAPDGSLAPEPGVVCTMPAAGGLWSTAADLVRFGLGWSSLLPAALRDEALRPQAAQQVPGAAMALGWGVNPGAGLYGHPGGGPGAAASLLVGRGVVAVACTNRRVRIEPVNARLVT